MMFTNLVQALLASTIAAAAAPQVKRAAPKAWSNFNDNPVFNPSKDATSWRTLYGRTLQLPDKSLLLSWEDYDPTVKLTYWPIYKSTDGGATYQNLTRVNDQVNGWGNWYQPFLFELPVALGGHQAGTILLAGVSTPRDLSQAYIDLYASTNSGNDWKFVSHIVYGPGPETINTGDKAVWEPFLMMHEGKLVVYYSTQVDPAHNQKLAHKTTVDLVNWSDEVNDVAQPEFNGRPGMATVAYSAVSKKYVLTFEYCNNPTTGGCPVYYKTATDPLAFGPEPVQPLVPDTSRNPQGSPFVIWTPEPGKDGQGVFIASGGNSKEVFVNSDAVDLNGWKPVNVGQWSAYSRELKIINTPADSPAKGAKKLMLTNGGNIGCSGNCFNYIVNGVVEIPTYPYPK